jgi:hypothetical protein
MSSAPRVLLLGQGLGRFLRRTARQDEMSAEIKWPSTLMTPRVGVASGVEAAEDVARPVIGRGSRRRFDSTNSCVQPRALDRRSVCSLASWP